MVWSSMRKPDVSSSGRSSTLSPHSPARPFFASLGKRLVSAFVGSDSIFLFFGCFESALHCSTTQLPLFRGASPLFEQGSFLLLRLRKAVFFQLFLAPPSSTSFHLWFFLAALSTDNNVMLFFHEGDWRLGRQRGPFSTSPAIGTQHSLCLTMAVASTSAAAELWAHLATLGCCAESLHPESNGPVLLPCGHSVCERCVERKAEHNPAVCRFDIMGPVIPSTGLRNYALTDYLSLLHEELFNTRALRTAMEPPTDSTLSSSSSSTPLQSAASSSQERGGASAAGIAEPDKVFTVSVWNTYCIRWEGRSIQESEATGFRALHLAPDTHEILEDSTTPSLLGALPVGAVVLIMHTNNVDLADETSTMFFSRHLRKRPSYVRYVGLLVKGLKEHSDFVIEETTTCSSENIIMTFREKDLKNIFDLSTQIIRQAEDEARARATCEEEGEASTEAGDGGSTEAEDGARTEAEDGASTEAGDGASTEAGGSSDPRQAE